MGGRLDATNTITHPEVSVITPISMDHQEFLGDTITAIAKEKAGIIRKNGRVILSAQTEDADSEIAAITQQLGASLHRVSDADREMIAHPRCLKGDHQIENAATAAAALSIWKRDSVRITKEHILRGSETAQWPGRMQHIKEGFVAEQVKPKKLYFDGAHNESAAHALANTINSLEEKHILVCSMLETKDHSEILSALSRAAKTLVLIPHPHGAAAAVSFGERNLAQKFFERVLIANSMMQAFDLASKESGDAITVCGSLYLGEKFAQLNGERSFV